MQLINAGHKLLTTKNGVDALKTIELIGRVCYKSEDRITDNSYAPFIKTLIEQGHESVIEHISVSVKFTCDRGISHELVRHRLTSISQESTRYVTPNTNGVEAINLEFIKPCYLDPLSTAFTEWAKAMWFAERAYKDALIAGCKPEEARAVLPNSYATRIVVTANLREWRHILRLRTSKAAHPAMREITIPLLTELRSQLPIIFDDIVP